MLDEQTLARAWLALRKREAASAAAQGVAPGVSLRLPDLRWLQGDRGIQGDRESEALTPMQATILGLLASEGPMSSPDIAERLDRSPSSCRNVLGTLRKQGHVRVVSKIRCGRSVTCVWGAVSENAPESAVERPLPSGCTPPPRKEPETAQRAKYERREATAGQIGGGE